MNDFERLKVFRETGNPFAVSGLSRFTQDGFLFQFDVQYADALKAMKIRGESVQTKSLVSRKLVGTNSVNLVKRFLHEMVSKHRYVPHVNHCLHHSMIEFDPTLFPKNSGLEAGLLDHLLPVDQFSDNKVFHGELPLTFVQDPSYGQVGFWLERNATDDWWYCGTKFDRTKTFYLVKNDDDRMLARIACGITS